MKNINFFLLMMSFTSIISCLPNQKNQQVTIVKASDIVQKNIAVNGMTCVGCEVTLEENISQIKGVVSVKASHKEKKATITFDSTKTDIEAIKKTIIASGYKLFNN